jgi:hypothetical protein
MIWDTHASNMCMYNMYTRRVSVEGDRSCTIKTVNERASGPRRKPLTVHYGLYVKDIVEYLGLNCR